MSFPSLSGSREVVLDILYPPTCLGCESDGCWLCKMCVQKIPMWSKGFCPACGERHTEGEGDSCKGDWPFASLLAIGSYAHPIVRAVVTKFKYQSATCLGSALETLFAEFRSRFQDPWPWAGLPELTIVAIPSDTRHIRLRGFDHGKLLPKIVQRTLVPWASIDEPLIRTAQVSAHAGLPANAARAANIRGAFQAVRKTPAHVLLIDDVFTTGATLLEAARVLKDAGIQTIHVLTVARR